MDNGSVHIKCQACCSHFYFYSNVMHELCLTKTISCPTFCKSHKVETPIHDNILGNAKSME
jgi:hypothetical protein